MQEKKLFLKSIKKEKLVRGKMFNTIMMKLIIITIMMIMKIIILIKTIFIKFKMIIKIIQMNQMIIS